MSTGARRAVALGAATAAVGVIAIVVTSVAWWQVTFIILLLGVLAGAASGLESREYTLRKRTYVRTSRPPR